MRAFRWKPVDVGRARAVYLATAFGRELRIARVAAGLTQAQLAQLAHVSQPEASGAERGAVGISLSARCRLAAACGHELGWRLYPTSTVRLRDSGQLGIAQAIATAADSSWAIRLEAPIGPGDLRAADMLLSGSGEILHVEIERAIVDLQAQLRSAQLKRQELARTDDRPVRLVIAVPDTRASRRRLAPFHELIERTLPIPSRLIWRAIQQGDAVGGDGILFVGAVRRDRSPRE
jgi:transcriptional regulator with XRE-family HTH domain